MVQEMEVKGDEEVRRCRWMIQEKRNLACSFTCGSSGGVLSCLPSFPISRSLSLVTTTCQPRDCGENEEGSPVHQRGGTAS